MLCAVLISSLPLVPAWGQLPECAGPDDCQPDERCLAGHCRLAPIVIRLPDRPDEERRLNQIHLRYRADGLARPSNSAQMRISLFRDDGDLDDDGWHLVGSLCTDVPRADGVGGGLGEEQPLRRAGGQLVFSVTHLDDRRFLGDGSRLLRITPFNSNAACAAELLDFGPEDRGAFVLEFLQNGVDCDQAGPAERLSARAVCSTSYQSMGNFVCEDEANPMEADNSGILIPLDDVWAPYVEGPAGPGARPAFNCRLKSPPAVYLALVLDKSGSMNALVEDEVRRIELLSASVKSLLRVWDNWRSLPLDVDDPAVPDRGGVGFGDDRVGVVLFDGDAQPIEDICAGRRPLNLTETALQTAANAGLEIPEYISGLLDEAAGAPAQNPVEHGGQHMRRFGTAALDFIGIDRPPEGQASRVPPGQGLCDDPNWAESGADAGPERARTFLPAWGSTSFGDGLAMAMGPEFLNLGDYEAELRNAHPDQRWRNVILFISDGRHNTPCGYEIDDVGLISFTGCGDQPEYDLRDLRDDAGQDLGDDAGQYLAQVHTIAIDAGGDAASEEMEQLAARAGGTHHYVDTLEGTTEDALREFFLDILQNTLRFNTWHVAQRIAIDDDLVELAGTWSDDDEQAGPLTVEDGRVPVHVPTTAKAVSFVAWWKDDATVQLDVWPPHAGRPITRYSNNGHIEFAIGTRPEWHDPAEPWRFKLQVVPENRVPDAEPPPLMHARALVFVDHDQLQPHFKIDGPLSREQGGVRITTRLQAFGRPIDVGADGRVYVNAKRPDASLMAQIMDACDEPELREMLDEIEMRAMAGVDVGSMLTELVAACRAAHPDLMTRSWYQVEMRDDGEGADLTAGDGVYSARFPGEDIERFYEGHYQIYINVDGADSQIGRFQLSHQQTVFVPQGVAPSPVDQAVQNAPGNAVRNPGARGVIERIAEITVTPRDMLGNPIGPGRGGYLWLRFDDDEISPRLLQDNLDGTYTARFSIGADDEIPHGEVVFIQKPIQLPVGVAPEVMIEHLDGPAGGPVLDAKGNPLVQLGRFGGFFEPPPIDGDFSGCDCSVDDSGDVPGSGVLMVLVGLMAVRRSRRASREH